MRIRTSSNALGRNPERSRCNEGIDGAFLPPCDFVSVTMDVTVMNPAQGHRELVAHLQPHRPRLGKSEVVGVGGASAADQTWLRRHEFEMNFIAQPSRLAERELAFVDLGGSCVSLLVVSKLMGHRRSSMESWPEGQGFRWPVAVVFLWRPLGRLELSLSTGVGATSLVGVEAGPPSLGASAECVLQSHPCLKSFFNLFGILRRQAILSLQDGDGARPQLALLARFGFPG